MSFAGEPPCKVAVMQLCMEKTVCYVLHIAHSGVPPSLRSLLEDNSSIKVGKIFLVLFVLIGIAVRDHHALIGSDKSWLSPFRLEYA
jgi:hypothetical protein